MRRTILHIKQILAWADAHHARTGNWPDIKSGRVWEAPDEAWVNINQALVKGLRGLRRGNSLPKLLAKYRGRRNRKQLPRYTIHQVLKWAKDHHTRRGRWPLSSSGPIASAPGETWLAVDMALRHGQRGMRSGSSLAKFLAAKCRVKHRIDRPRLTLRQILRWVDLHHQRTGNWPVTQGGSIRESDGDTWTAVDLALRTGRRGLRGGSSLAKLLARYRGVHRHVRKPPLTERQILSWADAFHARMGRWPNYHSGAIPEAPRETWLQVNEALSKGRRGLSGGMTLAKLLALKRNVRSRIALPALSERKILAWARKFRREHGRWPTRHLGIIPGSDGETWSGIDWALKHRSRGLARRSSLAQLLKSRVG